MSEPFRIVTVTGNDEDGLFVRFSNGATAGYSVDKQFEPMPCREDEGLKGPFSFFYFTVRLARLKKRT
jgi:hypothetical protein